MTSQQEIGRVLVLLLALLLIPLPSGSYKDGGTRAFTALSYKVVCWQRLQPDGTIYRRTALYLLPHSLLSIDELWEQEQYNAAQAK